MYSRVNLNRLKNCAPSLTEETIDVDRPLMGLSPSRLPLHNLLVEVGGGSEGGRDAAAYDSHLPAYLPELGGCYGNTGGFNQGPDAALRYSDHDECLRLPGGCGTAGSAQQDRADGKHSRKSEKRTSPAGLTAYVSHMYHKVAVSD